LIRELGTHPEGGTIGLYQGRYGPYVAHGGLYASLPKAANADGFTLAEALPLLAAQKAKGKTPRRAGASNGGAARKPARKAKRATAAKAPAARRTPSSRPASN
jgi:DNA topoisomerase-1